MCGIVGYNGTEKKAKEILIEGLKKLEYRGYDSAGIALKNNKNVNIIKSTGKIINLEKKLTNEDTTLGIGHTRWATHGIPCEKNSHPHQVGDITIVHNGIIENYKEIREKLEQNGYIFNTETDTEVACALIDYLYQKEKNIKDALSNFINEVKGAYAIAILVKDDSNLYAIRKDCPLVIATGKIGNFLASDVMAINKYTDKVLYLEPYMIAQISNKNVKIYNNKLELIKNNFQKMPKIEENSDKNGYDYFMQKEIYEEPEVFKKMINKFTDNDSIVNIPDLKKYKKIDIVACGSAYHAGLVGKSLIEEYANIPVNVDIASEYRYKKNFFDKNTLVILISQSGETADTLASLRLAKENKIDTLAIVNVENSSVAKESDYVIKTEAGPEIAVATTKAYLSQILTLALIAIKLKDKNITNEIMDDIKKMPFLIEETINNDYSKIAKSIYKNNNIFYIGRGIDYYLCQEGSLKLKEISYIHSEAYAAGELKHGTISLIEEGLPVISLITDDKLKAKTISNMEETKSRGAKLILVTNDDSIDNYELVVKIPKVNKLLQPLLSIIPFQLIAFETAKLRKCDIDKPKNLAKSVTVE